jgi:NADH-quinone oxidoreductase subunit J
MIETVLFYLISLALIVFAIGVIVSRSAIYSVLSLVGALCMMAGLFILLKAYLVATILVLVYAGAILVLFLFVVMLIDAKKVEEFSKNITKKIPLNSITAVLIAGVIFWQVFHVIRSIKTVPAIAPQGTTQAIGRLLFSQYLLPFELTSFLLLAAVVGVVVLAKKEAK